MDYPQDWLSAADRGSIGSEVVMRYRAFRAYQAAAPADRLEWCDRHAETLRRDGVTGLTVSNWIDLGGWWKGTRRGVALELRYAPDGSAVEWRAVRRKKVLAGTSSSIMTALQDIGVELSHRLCVDHQEKKRKSKEEAAEAA